jgi:Tfp pilus assembly protein PilN
MTIDKINFIEQKVTSVSETNTNRKLRLYSILIGVVLVIITAAVVFMDIFFTQKLNRVTEEQNNLISILGTAENKKKETLIFLIKDRLKQIKSTEKTRIAELDNLTRLKSILQVLTIDDFSIKGNVCSLTVETNDYAKINDFLHNLDEYQIASQSMTVTQTSFTDQKYKTTMKFNFL